MNKKDTYKTISKPANGEIFKDKNSKFFGYVYPIKEDTEIKDFLEQLKKEHHQARHWCYAYEIGFDHSKYRMNDDGEPSNSAGKPIYGQIQSFNLTNILIVVVRYYGGIKLGVSGLINAYRTAAKNAILASTIIEKTIDDNFRLNFEYKHMSQVMRILKENDINIKHQNLELSCMMEISVRKSKSLFIVNIFKQIYGVTIKSL